MRTISDIDSWFVAEAKLRACLLELTHYWAGSKALFLGRFGFEDDRWRDLELALRAHPERHGYVFQRKDEFGVTVRAQCWIETPDGRDPCVRSVWMIRHGERVDRLVTAYPA